MPELREILTNTIIDEVRRYGRSKRDPAVASLVASVDESSVRLEVVLEADQTSPSQQLIREEQLLALGEALGGVNADRAERSSCTISNRFSLADVASRMGRSQAAVAGLFAEDCEA